MGPKARRGNGTPHPKGRRSLLHEEEGRSSSLQTSLLHVHKQVTQTLHQIDTMVLDMHNHHQVVADAEVRSFAAALANFDENLQEWSKLFKAAAERSSDVKLPTTECLESIPDVSPLITDLENCTISYSPLVSSDFDSESLMRTPPGRTPSPGMPHMPSVRVLTSMREISPLSLYPSSECHPSTPIPERFTCQSQLVFETPGFGTVSPPRSCHPLRHVPAESVNVIPDTPVMPSPFKTPGILFDCNGECSSPSIVDDLTTSTVKRLGQKGLEERLWQELATRKADVLRSVQFR